MSEYQQRKARALELQRQKEEQLKREQAAKAERDKQRAREEEEKRKQRDAAAKEARRLELVRANEALNAGKSAAANGSQDWDPFAEDERPKVVPSLLHAKTTPRPKPPVGPASRSTAPGSSKPRPESSSAGPKVKRNKSPELLGRKERAARAMAQAAKKSKGADIFDVRSLVEGRDGPPPAVASASLPRKRPSSGTGPNGHDKANVLSRFGANGSSTGTVKDRLNASLKGEDMRKLCPDRSSRDRRTIDEIHNDIKSRKAGAVEPPAARVKLPRPSVPTTARRPVRRGRSPSEDYSSEEDGPRSKKKYRNDRGDHEADRAYISAEIQALFRRPGVAAPRHYDDDFSDASSDMEAGLSDVEQEEMRTARIARLEDLEAERQEREHREAKQRAKRERERQRAKV